jgi:hypothetical protein
VGGRLPVDSVNGFIRRRTHNVAEIKHPVRHMIRRHSGKREYPAKVQRESQPRICVADACPCWVRCLAREYHGTGGDLHIGAGRCRENELSWRCRVFEDVVALDTMPQLWTWLYDFHQHSTGPRRLERSCRSPPTSFSISRRARQISSRISFSALAAIALGESLRDTDRGRLRAVHIADATNLLLNKDVRCTEVLHLYSRLRLLGKCAARATCTGMPHNLR